MKNYEHDELFHEKLDNYISEFFKSDEGRQALSRYESRDQKGLPAVGSFVEDAHFALDLIYPYLKKSEPILEVGGGACLLARFLNFEGYNITVIDPADDFFSALSDIAFVDSQRFRMPTIIQKDVTECGLLDQEAFSVIFSLNVLEHVPNIYEALAGLKNSLAVKGVMIHCCPNYTVPYEPHIGSFVFPLFRERSVRNKANILFGRDSEGFLNFITYSDVVSIARELDLESSFRQGMLYHACKRALFQSEFSSRHRGIVKWIRFLEKHKFLSLLRYIPARFSTPMVFTLKR